MGYVAVKGGEKAIAEAARVTEFLRTNDSSGASVSAETIETQLRLLHSRVQSEGGLYDPELASLAIKQSAGDPLEAAYFLRAYRSTRPRLGVTPIQDSSKMRLIRRISSAFKEIPGGQRIGPTSDFTQRLFRQRLLKESPEEFQAIASSWFRDTPTREVPDSFPKVIRALRAEGLLRPRQEREAPPFDVTREPIVFPLPRSGALSIMARGETGGLLALAYSNMRGYGDVHPTIAELRVGYLPVEVPHPLTGEMIEIGEVLMTECEVVASHRIDPESGEVYLTTGYGACFGHNETKAICMAILDRALDNGRRFGIENPSEDPEFVLMHVDGIDSMGFAIHYKMPHYVTFESDLDRARKTREELASREGS